MAKLRESFFKHCLTRRYISDRFYEYHGYALNLKNPRTLSEKLHWIKANHDLRQLSRYVDKEKVRTFVEERVGSELLVPVIGLYDRFEEIDFDTLPSSFMLKTTHGSGWNIEVKCKETIDWPATGR
ncbi:hypothetical protein BOW53_13375 [Solemya pervernicosa gill symbiont]|uniref:Glycosyl transferase n=1 Tax=Solemya pervernicosa gill symbiont TaxID=642797 RepID=A0A1T2L1L2_9GAMM|nr:hypothetical protein BOW53_13375 [Solemya pervernicosa gill symbiont]